MTITLDAKRRLTVPLPLMGAARPGDVFLARYDAEEDTLSFRRLPPREDWLKVAALCPEVGSRRAGAAEGGGER